MNLYNHHFMDLSGDRIYTERYRNQPFLIVNIATGGRFASQFRQLQQLHSRFGRHGLVILAIAATDFGDEPRNEAGIERFLRENYPYSYRVTRRTTITGADAHPLFREILQEKGHLMLPDASFYKYLFDRHGDLLERWRPEVPPDDPGLVRAINQQLGIGV